MRHGQVETAAGLRGRQIVMEKKNLDWSNLGFSYLKTDKRYVANYKAEAGKWDEGTLIDDDMIVMSEDAGVLQYSQSVFEGLKAYTTKDGHIVTFRPDLNGQRMYDSALRLEMPPLPVEQFVDSIHQTVAANTAWVPPFGTGATLYVRPYMFGISPVIGVKPADDYHYRVFTTPVGPYFKGGFSTNPYVIIREYDRSAPLGTGKYKVGGNYAASMLANHIAHEKGYACEFYLDAKEKKYMDECGAANFFGIKNNTYVTPKSTSILPSITNKSLMQLAEDYGMKVERRQIPEEELDTFEEAGACGTAAVISPISYIDDLDTGKRYTFSKDGKPGPVSEKLYTHLRNIQYGIEPDVHGWTKVVID